jgi:hypothetical protein
MKARAPRARAARAKPYASPAVASVLPIPQTFRNALHDAFIAAGIGEGGLDGDPERRAGPQERLQKADPAAVAVDRLASVASRRHDDWHSDMPGDKSAVKRHDDWHGTNVPSRA